MISRAWSSGISALRRLPSARARVATSAARALGGVKPGRALGTPATAPPPLSRQRSHNFRSPLSRSPPHSAHRPAAIRFRRRSRTSAYSRGRSGGCAARCRAVASACSRLQRAHASRSGRSRGAPHLVHQPAARYRVRARGRFAWSGSRPGRAMQIRQTSPSSIARRAPQREHQTNGESSRFSKLMVRGASAASRHWRAGDRHSRSSRHRSAVRSPAGCRCRQPCAAGTPAGAARSPLPRTARTAARSSPDVRDSRCRAPPRRRGHGAARQAGRRAGTRRARRRPRRRERTGARRSAGGCRGSFPVGPLRYHGRKTHSMHHRGRRGPCRRVFGMHGRRAGLCVHQRCRYRCDPQCTIGGAMPRRTAARRSAPATSAGAAPIRSVA